MTNIKQKCSVLILALLFVGLVTASIGCSANAAPTPTVIPPTEVPPTPTPVLAAEKRHVVILYSYEADFFATTQEDEGIVTGLAQMGYVEGENLEITRLYMNTKTVNTTPEQMAAVAKEMVSQIEELSPDALILHDDDALRNVGSLLYGTELPIVFAGINGFPDDPNYSPAGALVDSFNRPGHNITGVLERISLSAGFELLHQVVPDAQTALFISDNSSITNLFMQGSGGAEELEEAPIKVVKQVYTNDYEELKATILDYQDKVDAIILFLPWTIVDVDGNHVPQQDVVSWMLQNNRRPGIAFLDVLAEEGYLTGMVVNMNLQGYHAATMVGEILNGANPARISVVDPVANRVMINLARADQLGIEIPFDILNRADVVLKEMTSYPEYEFTDK